jgi:hypothetical protein
MEVTIGLDDFCSNARLPEGLRFKEWEPCAHIAPSKITNDYWDSVMIGVERISDGKVEDIEIGCLRDSSRSSIRCVASELIGLINTAIEVLCPREALRASMPRNGGPCSFWAVRKRPLRSRFMSIEFRVETPDLVHCKECERVGESWSGTPDAANDHAKEILSGHGE